MFSINKKWVKVAPTCVAADRRASNILREEIKAGEDVFAHLRTNQNWSTEYI